MATQIKNLTASILLLTCTILSAQQNEWQDPRINQVNRAPMHSNYFAYENTQKAEKGIKNESENFLSLNGTWAFHFAQTPNVRPTNFYAENFDDSSWNKMPVPGLFELFGYGNPIYVNAGYAWCNQFKSNPPEIPMTNNYVGSYRRIIEIPATWNGKTVMAHFGSATSNLYLWVNGKYAGYSEDSKLEAEFDITPYLKKGKNLIAFQIFRWCDGTYLEDQDFMRYTGIARNCYLYARPIKHINDVHLQTLLDEQYKNAELAVDIDFSAPSKGCTAQLTLTDCSGKTIATKEVKSNGKNVSTTIPVKNPQKWSAEIPYLYNLQISLQDKGTELECIPFKVGFRSVEIKNSQLLVNGQPVLIKGANRHELDPVNGYIISEERMADDIKTLKSLNINAIRTCHYPDNNRWYELCDLYGIYVVAEANIESHGMGYGEKTLAIRPDYALAHMERNQRNVQRSRNHACVIVWSLGNEAGNGENFYKAYEWVKANDTTRPVQYEQAHADGKNSDIYCPMYAGYNHCENYVKNNPAKPLIQCEYAHAMGNSIGGFGEYWDLVRQYKSFQGGFIWDFADQSLLQKNQNGSWIYTYGGDWNKYDASDNNFMCNGIVSPDRHFNPHAYEVQYFYQNIWSALLDAEKGQMEIFNENFFKSTSDLYLKWDLLENGEIVQSGTIDNMTIQPQEKIVCTLPYDISSTKPQTELFLNVEFIRKKAENMLPAGWVTARQQMLVRAGKTEYLSEQKSTNTIVIDSTDWKYLRLQAGHVTLDFNKHNGYLCSYINNGTQLIQEGSELRPNFWRAPTDNDFGANLQRKYIAWKTPHLKQTAFKFYQKENKVYVHVEYNMENIGGQLTLDYEITACGTISVKQALIADHSKKVSDMFRFGMQVSLVKDVEKLTFYGHGPHENYCDRHHSQFMGKYQQTVTEQYYPYIRPQETGHHTDLRYLTLKQNNGYGITIYSKTPFEASALHHSIEQLDDGWDKDQRHGHEMQEENLTSLCIDQKQMGLGCINSWGALPLEKYRIPYDNREFEFTIVPELK